MFACISIRTIILSIWFVALITLSGCFSNEDLKEQLPNVANVQETTSLHTNYPHSKPYLIGRGDTISVKVLRRSDFSQVLPIETFIVQHDGNVDIPLVGTISVNELTVREVEEIVRAHVSKEVVEPVVAVSVTKSESRKILIAGNVKKPGIYPISQITTALEAVLSAGGFSKDADRNLVVLIRTKPYAEGEKFTKSSAYAMNLKDYLEGRDFVQNVLVQGGDIIYVPDDRIAKSNRFWGYITEIIRPFAETFGVIQGLVILDRSLE